MEMELVADRCERGINMTFDTWETIMKRLVWYRDKVLKTKMLEWPEEKIEACTDPNQLQYVLRLAERVERCQQRMDRHMEKGMALIPAGGKRPN
jgi:hypothetical protein